MSEMRFDRFARMLAGEASRRRFLASAVGGAVAAGLARSQAFAQDLAIQPTQTPDPSVFNSFRDNPSNVATLLPWFAPTPSDWSAEHPERVLLSLYGVHFFDLESGQIYNALNAQQAAALPQDTSLVGFFTFLQQPPRGGEPADVGRTLDLNQFFFPQVSHALVADYWESYLGGYFSGQEQKNLNIDGIPNARYVSYEVTVSDGRLCKVLAGVAQNGLFINHANMTTWDGTDPSASALKRVLGAVDARQQFAGQSELAGLMYRNQTANPIYWDSPDFGAENQGEHPILGAALVRPFVSDGIPIEYARALGLSDDLYTADSVLFGTQYSRGYPIDGTEGVMAFDTTPFILKSETAGAEWFEDYYNLQDHLPVKAEFAGRPYFDVESVRPTRDGTKFPAYETVIQDGQTVTIVRVLGGVPITDAPTDAYRDALAGIVEAARNRYIASLDNESPNEHDNILLETAVQNALSLQESCGQQLDACDSTR